MLKIGIWCEESERLYTIKNLVAQLIIKGCHLEIYVNNSNKKTISKYLNIKEQFIHDLRENATLRYKICSYLSYFILYILGSRKFSILFENQLRNLSVVERLARLITPKLNKSLRLVYTIIFRRFKPRVSGFDKLLVVSTVRQSFLFCGFRGEIALILDSWDHVYKLPVLFYPSQIIVWNSDLALDFKHTQNLNVPAVEIFPLRFRYIKEDCEYQSTSKELQAEMQFLSSGKVFWTYVCTHMESTEPRFSVEMKLINRLANWAERNSIFLYIKPKPGSQVNLLRKIGEKKHVFVGEQNIKNNLIFFNDDYHFYRKQLLHKTKMLINLGTTFVLEASLHSVPILQIRIESSEGSDEDDGYYWLKNTHLTKYIFGRSGSYSLDRSLDNFDNVLDEAYSSNEKCVEFSRNLQNWVGATPYQDTLPIIIKSLLGSKIC